MFCFVSTKLDRSIYTFVIIILFVSLVCPVVDFANAERSPDKSSYDLKDLLMKKLKVVPLFIRLMPSNGAIWSLDQRTVIMR